MGALDMLSAFAPVVALRGSMVAYLLVNAAHIGALGLCVAAIVWLDLRLWGLVSRQVPLALLGPLLSRASAVGGTGALATGLALFAVRPAEYLDNPAFRWKLMLLGVAVANAVVMHASGRWRRVLADGQADAIAKGHALVSLCAWMAALVAGRWIGFT